MATYTVRLSREQFFVITVEADDYDDVEMLAEDGLRAGEAQKFEEFIEVYSIVEDK